MCMYIWYIAHDNKFIKSYICNNNLSVRGFQTTYVCTKISLAACQITQKTNARHTCEACRPFNELLRGQIFASWKSFYFIDVYM